MRPDTARITIRNFSSPYEIIDLSDHILNSSGSGMFNFSNVSNGVNYYLIIKHRNSIETWSSSGISFTSGQSSYDFTPAAGTAFGNNIVQVDSSPVSFAIYSGDVNQEGVVDGTDGLMIDNDAFNFITGYVPSDVNGDNFVDGSDALITGNNSDNFVTVVETMIANRTG